MYFPAISPFLSDWVTYTAVIHSRNEEWGGGHKVNSPKNQSQFSQMMMGQYWLMPVFQIDLKCLQQVAKNCEVLWILQFSDNNWDA